MASPGENPMGVHWTAIVFGLGAIGATAYWTTDFLVVQRVLAARDLRAARTAPNVKVGRWCTILGILVSIGTAYAVMRSESIMQ